MPQDFQLRHAAQNVRAATNLVELASKRGPVFIQMLLTTSKKESKREVFAHFTDRATRTPKYSIDDPCWGHFYHRVVGQAAYVSNDFFASTENSLPVHEVCAGFRVVSSRFNS
jgi:hypothetical protein